MNGPTPLSATDLRLWADGTHTELGCIDFQDILDASREAVSAISEYSETQEPAPWSPEMTPEELAKAMATEERLWDFAMGV